MKRRAFEVRIDRDILPLVHGPSAFSTRGVAREGVYVRVQSERRGLTESRAKIVTPDFVAGIANGGRWDRRRGGGNGNALRLNGVLKEEEEEPCKSFKGTRQPASMTRNRITRNWDPGSQVI